VFHLAGLYFAGKRQNFLTQYEKAKDKNKDEGKSYKEIIMVGSTLAVMLVALGVGLVIKTINNRKLSDIMDYNQSPDVIFSVATYDSLEMRNSFLTGQYTSIESMDENILTYPVCNTKILELINKCAGNYAEISFQSFDSESGTMNMTATADTVDNINKFIRELLEQDIFNDVNYTGYTYQSGDETWNINVSCTLAESAGR
jgi:hypothetical protein